LFAVLVASLCGAGSTVAQSTPLKPNVEKIASQDSARPPAAPGVTGVVLHHRPFPSKHVAARNVDVWLPPSYAKETAKRYAVVYMQDGQNLFDPKTSFLGVDWGIDETMTLLIEEKKVREAIIVGIWNTPKRVQEYLPAKMLKDPKFAERRAKVFQELSRFGVKLEEKDLLADKYLKFLVEELKPFIDKTYRTKPGPAETFIGGSSAGALISLYAVSEYPQVFGGAACISTHWPIGDGLMIDDIRDRLPDPKTHKLYFDFGTETLDKGYEPYQEKMDAVLRARGYEKDRNWMTRKYPGAEHSERSWRERVHAPLEFLLSP
jgi:predicted alpha/beta superfamily hydrolase